MNKCVVFVSLFLLVALALSGCAAPTPTPPPPTTTPVSPTTTPTPATLKEMAEQVATGVGKVMKVVEGDAKKVLFVFEEIHDSRLGQVEIAIMLNRLYAQYRLRHVGLEGHIADKGPLNLAWAHRQPYYQPDQKITGREDVIVQTLEDGEISSAEMLGLVYQDAVIDGIDDAKLYAFEASREVKNALPLYLYNIALARMSGAQRTAWQALVDQKKYDDAFNFAISTDAFAAKMWAPMTDPNSILAAEEMPIFLDSVKAEAQKAGAKMKAQDEANLAALRDYYQNYVAPRSDAMAANILKVAAVHPGAPLAMIIGASHTARVEELLTKAGTSVVVVRALSLAEGSKAGMLSDEAYARKYKGLSVAPAGHLGAWLDGRKKPPPVSDKERSKQEVLIRETLQWLAEQAATLHETWRLRPEAIEIRLNDMVRDPKVVNKLQAAGIKDVQIHNVRVPEKGYPILWVTIEFMDGLTLEADAWATESSKPFVDLEHDLMNARDNLRKETQPPPETKPGDPPSPEQICSNVQALFTD